MTYASEQFEGKIIVTSLLTVDQKRELQNIIYFLKPERYTAPCGIDVTFEGALNGGVA